MKCPDCGEPLPPRLPGKPGHPRERCQPCAEFQEARLNRVRQDAYRRRQKEARGEGATS